MARHKQKPEFIMKKWQEEQMLELMDEVLQDEDRSACETCNRRYICNADYMQDGCYIERKNTYETYYQ